MSYKILYYISIFLTLLQYVFRKKLPINLQTFTKLTSTLTFSSESAIHKLNWKPNPVKNRVCQLLQSTELKKPEIL